MLGAFPVIPQVRILRFCFKPRQLYFFISEVKDAPGGSGVFYTPHSIVFPNQ
jgi:hypothetical protein